MIFVFDLFQYRDSSDFDWCWKLRIFQRRDTNWHVRYKNMLDFRDETMTFLIWLELVCVVKNVCTFNIYLVIMIAKLYCSEKESKCLRIGFIRFHLWKLSKFYPCWTSSNLLKYANYVIFGKVSNVIIWPFLDFAW